MNEKGPNEYTLKRRKDGAVEIKKWQENPLSYEKALEQTKRMAEQNDAISNNSQIKEST